jgi:membrane-associated phospholipid phosphatase
MVGIGGLLGIVYALSEIYIAGISQFLFPAIILTGLVGYSRLRLKAHQPIEIYSGLLVGFLSEYLLQWN